MIVTEDAVPVPFEIGGEKGTLMLFPGEGFKPEAYSYHPLLGGSVVLAMPHNGTRPESEVKWHLLVRERWPDRTPEEIARGYWSGIVWTICRSFQLRLSSYEGDPSSYDSTLTIRTPVGALATVRDDWIDLINHVRLARR